MPSTEGVLEYDLSLFQSNEKRAGYLHMKYFRKISPVLVIKKIHTAFY